MLLGVIVFSIWYPDPLFFVQNLKQGNMSVVEKVRKYAHIFGILFLKKLYIIDVLRAHFLLLKKHFNQKNQISRNAQF